MILRQLRQKSPSMAAVFSRKTLKSFGSISDSQISELNQEMESIFGAATSSSANSPPALTHVTDAVTSSVNDPPTLTYATGGVSSSVYAPALTHVTPGGDAQMVNVSDKKTTKRTALATCKVLLGKEAFDLVAADKMAKGDVITVAKIAGIGGAKRTADLIPLCHDVGLCHVDVDLRLREDDFSVRVAAEAVAEGKTGVEMEALTAAAVAALTVYDMCKAVTKEIEITDVRLERKTGGKSGDWSRKDN